MLGLRLVIAKDALNLNMALYNLRGVAVCQIEGKLVCLKVTIRAAN